jgi:hypothetical protein
MPITAKLYLTITGKNDIKNLTHLGFK